MDNKHNGGFAYTYSATEQEEIRRIREKYTARSEQEDKLARLRRLDAAASQRAQTVALVLGVLGALVLGFGMSLVLSDLGARLGLSATLSLGLGVGVGLLGCIPVSLAYPIYQLTLKRARARIAPEILRLSDELMK